MAQPSTSTKSLDLTILPLGDSITEGFMYGSAPENSYRKALLSLLLNKDDDNNTSPSSTTSAPAQFSIQGKEPVQVGKVKYVGTLTDGDFEPNDHDGFIGAHISQVWDLSDVLRGLEGQRKKGGGKGEEDDNAEGKKSWDGSSEPNVVLLCLGTNDMNNDPPQDGIGPFEEAPKRLGELIDRVVELLPGAVLLVAKICQAGWGGTKERIAVFNAGVEDVVRVRKDKGWRLELVDMSVVGVDGQDTIDGLHPNEKGYRRMAAVWMEGLMRVVERGWIECRGGE